MSSLRSQLFSGGASPAAKPTAHKPKPSDGQKTRPVSREKDSHQRRVEREALKTPRMPSGETCGLLATYPAPHCRKPASGQKNRLAVDVSGHRLPWQSKGRPREEGGPLTSLQLGAVPGLNCPPDLAHPKPWRTGQFQTEFFR